MPIPQSLINITLPMKTLEWFKELEKSAKESPLVE